MVNNTNSTFEQYEFKGWLITIENYLGTENLVAFATPTKYIHILDIHNYMDIDTIAKENGISEYDLNYLIAEPDDPIVKLNNVNTKAASSMLDYIVKEILLFITPQNQIERELGINRYDDTKTIVLKQICKKEITPQTTKRKRGFHQVAWASLVKLRDKKCVKCGSVHKLHAHHIKPYKNYPELRYDINNGETLCSYCHIEYHRINGR